MENVNLSSIITPSECKLTKVFEADNQVRLDDISQSGSSRRLRITRGDVSSVKGTDAIGVVGGEEDVNFRLELPLIELINDKAISNAAVHFVVQTVVQLQTVLGGGGLLANCAKNIKCK